MSRKVLGLVLAVFAVWFVVAQPVAAAALARNIGGWLYDAAGSITTFAVEVTGTEEPRGAVG